MKILLVDDDADDRFFFIEAVKVIDCEIECECAIDGAEGIQKLTAYTKVPDAVFLDLNMPIMSGKECFEKIRSYTRFKEMPVVICSTSSNPSEINWFRRLGAGYIVKPGSFTTLVHALKQYIVPMKHKVALARM